MARKQKIQNRGPYKPTATARMLEGMAEEQLKSQGIYITGKGFMDFVLHEFEFGTISGLWERNESAIRIFTVKNSNPGNGYFAKFMRALIAMGQKSGRRIEFVETMNKRLEVCLARDYGFQHWSGGMVRFSNSKS